MKFESSIDYFDDIKKPLKEAKDWKNSEQWEEIVTIAKEEYRKGRKDFKQIVNIIFDNSWLREWIVDNYQGNEFNLQQELEDIVVNDLKESKLKEAKKVDHYEVYTDDDEKGGFATKTLLTTKSKGEAMAFAKQNAKKYNPISVDEVYTDGDYELVDTTLNTLGESTLKETETFKVGDTVYWTEATADPENGPDLDSYDCIEGKIISISVSKAKVEFEDHYKDTNHGPGKSISEMPLNHLHHNPKDCPMMESNLKEAKYEVYQIMSYGNNGWGVLVDGMLDTDIPPQKTEAEAIAQAKKVYGKDIKIEEKAVRSLVPIYIHWNQKNTFSMSYPGGNKVFNGSAESFEKFLKKLGASEASTSPRSARTWTYKAMVDAVMSGEDPNIYVFSNRLAEIPQMVINEAFGKDSFKNNDLVSIDDQISFRKQVSKELDKAEIPIYFDNVDMVDDKTDTTIFSGALTGKHSYKELKDFIVDKYSLDESDNGPSDEDVQKLAYEKFHAHWDALSSKEQDEIYKELGYDPITESKLKESYGDTDIQADLKKGQTADQVVKNIIDRYPNMPLEAAMLIVDNNINYGVGKWNEVMKALKNEESYKVKTFSDRPKRMFTRGD